jgi:hypothetical protein
MQRDTPTKSFSIFSVSWSPIEVAPYVAQFLYLAVYNKIVQKID